MHVSPSTRPGWLLGQLRSPLELFRREQERGASAVELVIIAAVLVAIAAVVGVIIYNLVISPAPAPPSPPIPGGP